MGSRRQRKMRIVAYFALVATIIGSATAQEFSEAAAEDERTFNGNGNFNNLGGFDFNNLFTNQNIGTCPSHPCHSSSGRWRWSWRTLWQPPPIFSQPCGAKLSKQQAYTVCSHSG